MIVPTVPATTPRRNCALCPASDRPDSVDVPDSVEAIVINSLPFCRLFEAGGVVLLDADAISRLGGRSRSVGHAMVQDHGLAMRLDSEKQERAPDQPHAKGQEQESRKHRLGGLSRRDEVAGSGDQSEAERPDDLTDPVRRLTKARGPGT